MAKSLVNKLIDKVRKGALIAAAVVASIGVASCDLCGPKPEPINYAPVASLSVSPTLGDVPLNIQINLDGTDANGKSGILEYKIGIDNNGNNKIDVDEEIISNSSPFVNYPVTLNDVGPKKILGQVTDSQGAIDTKNIEVIVCDPFHPKLIQGSLQDNETDTNQPGEVKLYVNDIEDAQKDIDGGDFSFSVPSGSNVKLRGIIKDGTQKSYVRTLNLGGVTSNQTGVLVRAVPYPDSSKGENFSTQQFRDFMDDINIPNITKFDLDNFTKIKILKNNSSGSSNGSFSDPANLVTRIQNNNIFGWFVGKVVPIEIVNDAITNMPSPGEIIIEPYKEFSNPNQLGETVHYPVGSYFSNSALIKLKSTSVNPVDYTIAHEFGHASEVAYDEANVTGHLSYPLTVMEYLSSTPANPVSPGAADLKAAKVINENTYKAEELLNNILGTDTF